MSILSFFRPQVLEKVDSPVSGEISKLDSRKLEIKVIEQFGKRRVEIGGLTQSGGLVEEVWRKSLDKIRNSKFEIRNCLILGLGCGTAAKIINSRLRTPSSQLRLTGVELDPEVIRLGKKYFGLGEIENLEIVIGDAVEYVSRESGVGSQESGAGRFDLILVDLYQGREVPKSCQTKRFLEGLKGVKGRKGVIIFNRLYSKDKRREADDFVKKCREIFKEVKTSKALCNLMICCR